MVERTAEAEWKGSLTEGSGFMKLGSRVFEGRYSFKSRFENEQRTNPEELIAAAHAGCFSMAFALMLGHAGFTPRRIHTTAKTHIERAAEWLCRTVDRIYPARVCGPFRRRGRGASAPNPASLCSLLQQH